ncbi:Hypothetical protein FKW44_005235, partial [Caligus rogercresseyi]
RDLMHELLNLPIINKLKKGVVPTLNLNEKIGTNLSEYTPMEPSSKRNDRILKRNY